MSDLHDEIDIRDRRIAELQSELEACQNHGDYLTDLLTTQALRIAKLEDALRSLHDTCDSAWVKVFCREALMSQSGVDTIT